MVQLGYLLDEIRTKLRTIFGRAASRARLPAPFYLWILFRAATIRFSSLAGQAPSGSSVDWRSAAKTGAGCAGDGGILRQATGLAQRTSSPRC